MRRLRRSGQWSVVRKEWYTEAIYYTVVGALHDEPERASEIFYKKDDMYKQKYISSDFISTHTHLTAVLFSSSASPREILRFREEG